MRRQHIYNMDTLDRGIINVSERMELDGARFYMLLKNSTQFKVHGLFILEIII